MASITTLKSHTGGVLYPVTKHNAVYDSNGSTLPSDFSEIALKGDLPTGISDVHKGGGSKAGSLSTSESTILNLTASSDTYRIFTFCINTYNTGSQAADIFVRYGSTSGDAYGGSTSASSTTPSSTTKIAQIQLSTNSRHATKTLTFVVPPNTAFYVRGIASTTLYYTCYYTSGVIYLT